MAQNLRIWRAHLGTSTDGECNGAWRSPNQVAAALINALPPELIADIFSYLSAPRLDSMQDVLSASLVCRYWRKTALSVARIWANVHVVVDGMDPVIVDRFCARSAPLPISFRCDDAGEPAQIDEAIFPVLSRYTARIEELLIPNESCHLLEMPHARDLLARPFPCLRMLWIAPTYLPALFLGSCAQTLTTLCIPPSVVPLLTDCPALRHVTTFRVAHGLLTQPVLESTLRLCPNMRTLIHAASFRQPADIPAPSAVRLQTLCYFDSQVSPSFSAPMLELLNHSHIAHITVLDMHPDSIAPVLAPLGAIVRATLDWSDGYIEVSDARGFVRCFHGCNSWRGKPFRALCALPSATWSLTSLAVVGPIPEDFQFPPLACLTTLIIGLSGDEEDEPTPFDRSWPCPLLSVLQLSLRADHPESGRPARCQTETIPTHLVSKFIAERLAVPRLAELRLDSVRLNDDVDLEIREIASCDRVVQTPRVLEHASDGGHIPYALDKPWEHHAWFRLQWRKRKPQT